MTPSGIEPATFQLVARALQSNMYISNDKQERQPIFL